MKLLLGKELAGYIEELQAKRVYSLIQSSRVVPRLAIINTSDNPVNNLYVRLKKQYAEEIGVSVEEYKIDQLKAVDTINELNQDENVHGIIIQLPIEDPTQTEELVNLVSPAKDIDALGVKALFDPATPTAILWLLSGFNVEFQGKKTVLVGKGKLVGKPLYKMLTSMGVEVVMVDRSTDNISDVIKSADILITATGQRSIIKANMIKVNAVVVDAGVASENGKTYGDLDDEVFDRDDLTITPKKGGVGPLTICALFNNVIISAERSIK